MDTTTTTRPRAALETWGRDHYNLLLYVETRVVDHNGTIDHQHLRTDRARYGTRLRPPLGELAGHDDRDVLRELALEGLVLLDGSTLVRGLTPRGWTVAGAIRRARAESGRLPAAQIAAMHDALTATACGLFDSESTEQQFVDTIAEGVQQAGVELKVDPAAPNAERAINQAMQWADTAARDALAVLEAQGMELSNDAALYVAHGVAYGVARSRLLAVAP